MPMTIVPNVLTIGDKQYNRYNGTDYHVNTDPQVIDLLDLYRRNGNPLRLHFGHTEPGHEKLGRDWLEEFDTYGRIGRSMGNPNYAHGGVHAPLLILKRADSGGGAILDHCIVRIRNFHGNDLYRHPHYHHGKVIVQKMDKPMKSGRKTLYYESLVDGETHARFRSLTEATVWATELGLEFTLGTTDG